MQGIVLWLASFYIEMKCPTHGLERYKIKIVRRFNMEANTIKPKFRSRPTPGDLSCLLVGRSVSDKEMKRFLADYFRRKGLIEKILGMHIV